MREKNVIAYQRLIGVVRRLGTQDDSGLAFFAVHDLEIDEPAAPLGLVNCHGVVPHTGSSLAAYFGHGCSPFPNFTYVQRWGYQG